MKIFSKYLLIFLCVICLSTTSGCTGENITITEVSPGPIVSTTPAPKAIEENTPAPTPMLTPEPVATPKPTVTATLEPIAIATSEPTVEPTPLPTYIATPEPIYVDNVPAYSGNAYVYINNNIPYFTSSEFIVSAFENYSNLDSLGRCGVAYANVCTEIMPTEERGEIGMIKPTGWHTIKYECVSGKYLYNRCHLIGFQLAGENANEKNLITGTRYMNIDGMEPFENDVADYVKRTNNHVLYRVTPCFEGNNLVASGVEMEAYSVEDNGAGIKFNVYCYNVQPGISIDYSTGDSYETDGSAGMSDGNVIESNSSSTEVDTSITDTTPSDSNYVGNGNTKKFHSITCSSIAKMNELNKVYFTNREEAIINGYEPCKICNP